MEELRKRVKLEEVELVGVTYSMADGINKITDIRKVKNRGVLAEKTGEYIGGGTKVFDEISASGMPAVAIPGLHRGMKVLDRHFRALYSHCASAEKVSLSYHCYLEVNKRMKAENLIISDVGSNTVTIGIKDGRFFGAIDACLGAIGTEHGPLDMEAIREIDRGKISANRAFYRAGARKIRDKKLALKSMVMSIRMEVSSFLSEIAPEAIVITGSAGASSEIFRRLKPLKKVARVFRINGYSAAIGSAEIARDVLLGRKDFLGIRSDYS